MYKIENFLYKNTNFIILRTSFYLIFNKLRSKQAPFLELKQPTMSEEYVMLQYQIEQLKKDLAYWMQVASDAVREKNEHIAPLTQRIDELVSENDEYKRTNDRIWETTKSWIREDSDIISKQAGQIKYLVAKVKSLEKQES